MEASQVMELGYSDKKSIWSTALNFCDSGAFAATTREHLVWGIETGVWHSKRINR